MDPPLHVNSQNLNIANKYFYLCIVLFISWFPVLNQNADDVLFNSVLILSSMMYNQLYTFSSSFFHMLFYLIHIYE